MVKIKKVRNLVITSFVLFFISKDSYRIIKGYNYANNVYQKHLKIGNHKELIVAHRGLSGLYPDNSFDSIKAAEDSPCVDIIEIDVRMTQNKKIILHHDSFLNLEDSIIRIEDLSLEEFDDDNPYTVKNYKYYNLLDFTTDDQLFLYQRFLKKKINLDNLVFLSNVVRNYMFDKPLIVDVKTEYEDLSFMEELDKILKPYQNNIYIQSSCYEFLNKMVELYPDYKYLFIVNSKDDIKMQNNQFTGYTVKYNLLNRINIDNDKLYLIYTINSNLKYNNLLNNKNYRDNMYIITDNPDYICALSDNKLLRK